MDEVGLPVQRPFRVHAYLLVAGTVLCASFPIGVIIASGILNDHPRVLYAAAGVTGVLPFVARNKLGKLTVPLGKAGGLVRLAFVVGLFVGLSLLLVAITGYQGPAPGGG